MTTIRGRYEVDSKQEKVPIVDILPPLPRISISSLKYSLADALNSLLVGPSLGPQRRPVS